MSTRASRIEHESSLLKGQSVTATATMQISRMIFWGLLGLSADGLSMAAMCTEGVLASLQGQVQLLGGSRSKHVQNAKLVVSDLCA